jgi:hypothetical protein
MKNQATEYTEKQPDKQPVIFLYLNFSGCYSVLSVAKFAIIPKSPNYYTLRYNYITGTKVCALKGF